jgi:hypothetical protein
MIAPLVGWRVAGWFGAVVSSLALFGPSAVVAGLVLGLWHRFKDKPWRRIVQAGLVPMTVGLVASSATLVARSSDDTFSLAAITAIACCLIDKCSRAARSLPHVNIPLQPDDMFHQLFGLPPYWVWVAAQRASLCSIANHPSVPTCASVSPPSAAVVKGGRRPTPRQRRLALDQREHGGTLGAVGTQEGIGLSVNPKPQGDHLSHRRKARTQVTHVKQRSSPLL